jgi:hypothetical protein
MSNVTKYSNFGIYFLKNLRLHNEKKWQSLSHFTVHIYHINVSTIPSQPQVHRQRAWQGNHDKYPLGIKEYYIIINAPKYVHVHKLCFVYKTTCNWANFLCLWGQNILFQYMVSANISFKFELQT